MDLSQTGEVSIRKKLGVELPFQVLVSEVEGLQVQKRMIGGTGCEGIQAGKQVSEITSGEMCRTVVEATGEPAVGAVAADIAGVLGEVILLGTPRGAYQGDITELLSKTHLWSNGCVTIKGAHEWRYPRKSDTQGHLWHSIERNVRIIFRLIADGRLHVEELTTHLVSPAECSRVYEGLRNRKNEYVGVVFDWSQ